jgi:N12 class adenine-specific DNA methylase
MPPPHQGQPPGTPPDAEPGIESLGPDAPSAEPIDDLLAQAQDLADPENPRQGLWLSAANLDALANDPQAASDLRLKLASIVEGELSPEVLRNLAKGDPDAIDAYYRAIARHVSHNFDGQGGDLIASTPAMRARAERTRDGRIENGDPAQQVHQEIIGRLTGAGTGKPPSATGVVQQVTPQGAVTRESAVTPATQAETEADLAAPGRTVRTVTPQEAIGRRTALVSNAAKGPGTRANPVRPETPDDVAVASLRVPEEPTEAQREAGNYPKGHLNVHGLDISIETAKGGIRRGDGWENVSPAAYGYFKGPNVKARARDGEHPDVYVGDNPQSTRAFIIDQYEPDSDTFDEPKVVVGVDSQAEATRIYDAGFSNGSGPQRRGRVSEVSIDELKAWLRDGDATRPYAPTDEQINNILDLTDEEIEDIVEEWQAIKVASTEKGLDRARLAAVAEMIERLGDTYGRHILRATSEDGVRDYLYETQGRGYVAAGPEAAAETDAGARGPAQTGEAGGRGGEPATPAGDAGAAAGTVAGQPSDTTRPTDSQSDRPDSRPGREPGPSAGERVPGSGADTGAAAGGTTAGRPAAGTPGRPVGEGAGIDRPAAGQHGEEDGGRAAARPDERAVGGRGQPADTGPLTLGQEEWVHVDGLGAIQARIDTGAARSSLHATKIKVEGQTVRFTTRGPEREQVEMTATLEGFTTVTRAGAKPQKRPIAKIDIRIGDRDLAIEVTLNDRSRMAYPMLIGRQAMELLGDDVVVAPTRSFVLGKPVVEAEALPDEVDAAEPETAAETSPDTGPEPETTQGGETGQSPVPAAAPAFPEAVARWWDGLGNAERSAVVKPFPWKAKWRIIESQWRDLGYSVKVGLVAYHKREVAPDFTFIPKHSWRENLIKAREYANALKIDHRDKQRTQIVALIDEAWAAHVGAPEGVEAWFIGEAPESEQESQGGKYSAIAERRKPHSVAGGYGNTPEAAVRKALSRLEPVPAPSSEPTTKQPIKVRREGAAPQKQDAGEPAEDPFAKATREAKEYVLRMGKQDGKEHGVTVRPDGTSIIASTKGNRTNFIQIDPQQTPELYQDQERILEFHHNHPSSRSFSNDDIGFGTSLKSLKRLYAHGHNGTSYQADYLLGAQSHAAARSAYYRAQRGVQTPLQQALDAKRIEMDLVNRYFWHLVNLVIHDAGVIRYSFQFADQEAANREVSALLNILNPTWDSIVAEVRKEANVPDRQAEPVRPGERVEGAPSRPDADSGSGRSGGEGRDQGRQGGARGERSDGTGAAVQARKPVAPTGSEAAGRTNERGPDQLKDYTGVRIPGQNDDGATKREFLADARNYLNKVAKALEARGFAPHPIVKEGKGKKRTEKPGRAVAVIPGGPAVSGDVSLAMIDGDGHGVYAQIGTALAGPNGGISLMVRQATRKDQYGTRSRNNWWPVNLTAQELADQLEALATGRAPALSASIRGEQQPETAAGKAPTQERTEAGRPAVSPTATEPDLEAAGKWWRHDLTPAGREQVVERLVLPASVAKMLWHHISPERQQALARAYAEQAEYHRREGEARYRAEFRKRRPELSDDAQELLDEALENVGIAAGTDLSDLAGGELRRVHRDLRRMQGEGPSPDLTEAIRAVVWERSQERQAEKRQGKLQLAGEAEYQAPKGRETANAERPQDAGTEHQRGGADGIAPRRGADGQAGAAPLGGTAPQVPGGEPSADGGRPAAEGDAGAAPRSEGDRGGADVRGDVRADESAEGGRRDVHPETRPVPADTRGRQRDRSERERVRAVVEETRAKASKEIADRSRSNYRITDADEIGKGGPKAKVRANIAAIRVLRMIEAERREATAEEKQVLVKYVGWGAFAQDIFSEHKAEWSKERKELRDLLSQEEYEAARLSTLNAHYTSADVVKGMWAALEHLGLTADRVGTARALEPSAGVGHFIGLSPETLTDKVAWTAVELDKVTGGILKALYGGTDVRVQGFETVNWPDAHFDLAISNVPFGQIPIRDTRYKRGFNIHDYFFVKALDKVRPGGVVAFITSRYTLDKVADSARREIASRATFLGAIRLPGGRQGAFAGNAGTDVTTDIIFLRRRMEGEAQGDQSWLELKEVKTPEGPVKINAWLADHPEAMLGKMRLVGTMYKDDPVLVGSSENLDARIAETARAVLPADAFIPRAPTSVPVDEAAIDTDTDGIKEGSYYEKDGQLYRKVVGVGQPVKKTKTEQAVIRAFMPMRDIVNELLLRQSRGNKEDLADLRARLEKTYDAFVKKFGPINLTKVTEQHRKDGKVVTITRYPNLNPFRDDPDAFKVAAIENYEPETGTASKAAIFHSSILGSYQRPAISGPLDALAVSANELGRVDMPFIATLLDVSEEAAIEQLGGRVFLDPKGETWKMADQYLSGDVVTKLEDALAAAAIDARYERNVKALKDVQPVPLTREDVSVPVGAPWVPAEDYKAWLREIMQIPGYTKLDVKLNPVSKTWSVDTQFPRAAQAQFGTESMAVKDIVEHVLNSTGIRITYTVTNPDGSTTTVFDQKATEAAQDKARALKATWVGDEAAGLEPWPWKDSERATRLVASYNAQFNRLVPFVADGSHLTLPGLATHIGGNIPFELRPHQKNAVWRTIVNGNTLLDHVVGAGKTFTIVASAMEQKRLGLIQRPMVAVPNHMLEQFSREWLQAYPNAKLLIADKESMSKDRRKELAARVAAEQWDGIIITHSAFGRIRMSDQAYKDFYQEQIQEVLDALEAEKDAGTEKRDPTVKQLEQMKKRIEAQIEKLTNKERKDEGITFEEMGVDFIYVDEAHLFKNLHFMTRHGRLKGLATAASQRATDLFLKIRSIERSKPGRAAVFATGTPVSNTMAEMYTMQRYLQLAELEKYGLDKFDAWAATFGDITSQIEVDVDGRSFKQVTSFSKFVNIPELVQLYSRVADTQTADMLNLPRPKLKGGTVSIVDADLAPHEEAYMDSLVKRAEAVRSGGVKPEVDNMLKIMSEGRKLATDYRLLFPDTPYNHSGKISKAVENIWKIYKRGSDNKKKHGADAYDRAQIVFLDMGVPGRKRQAMQKPVPEQSAEDEANERIKHLRDAIRKDEIAARDSAADEETETNDADARENLELFNGAFNLYDDIRDRLIERGIPAKEIAYIHDAKTDDAKIKLFGRVRSGDVRILLGSTGKMGVGTNVQTRLIAMHHLDAPWKPAEVEQRDGRILRQGNLNPEIEIFRYVTKRSLDAFMWQTLERKSGFIAQVRAGAKGIRTAEDIDSPLPEAAAIKAAASGDERILEHAELSKEVKELDAAKRGMDRTVQAAKSELAAVLAKIVETRKVQKAAEQDAKSVTDTRGDKFAMTLDVAGGAKRVNERRKAADAIKAYVLALANGLPYRQYSDVVIGTISGFSVEMRVTSTQETRDGNVVKIAAIAANLRGPSGRPYGYAGFHADAESNLLGLVTRFENIVAGVPAEAEAARQAITQYEQEIPKLEAATQPKPFPKEERLKQAKARLAELTKVVEAATKQEGPAKAKDETDADETGGVQEGGDIPIAAFNAPAASAPTFTPAFSARYPEAVAALRRELERMVGPDIAVKLLDRLTAYGQDAAARYQLLKRVVSVSLSQGPRSAKVKAFHDIAAHMMRESVTGEGLYRTHYTAAEWQILVERARKTNAEARLASPIPGVPAIEAYRRVYTKTLKDLGMRGAALRARVEELVDQERVGALAEQWAKGTDFGNRVNSLLSRILKFMRAVANAVRGLGFQTEHDIFLRVVSGEQAARAREGRPAAGSWAGVRRRAWADFTSPRGMAAMLAAGEAQRGEIDALGYYSKALEAAKSWPQTKGAPEQVLQHILKAGTGVKNEIEATGLRQFLEGKKSVTRDEVVAYLRANRTVVKEARYGEPNAADAALRRAIEAEGVTVPAGPNAVPVYRDLGRFSREARRRILDRVGGEDRFNELLAQVNQPTQALRWAPYQMDPGNDTNRELVVHLSNPQADEYMRLTARLDELVAERNALQGRLDRLVRREDADPADVARLDAIEEELRPLRRARAAVHDVDAFKDSHFPDQPNPIVQIATSLQRTQDGKVAGLLDRFQSQWAQNLRDSIRNAMAKEMFGPEAPETKARIAELEARLKDLQQRFDAIPRDQREKPEGTYGQFEQRPYGYDRPLRLEVAALHHEISLTQGEITNLRTISDFRSLSKEQKAAVSKEIARRRKAGETLPGARDERKIADLQKRYQSAVTALETAHKAAQDWLKAHKAELEEAWNLDPAIDATTDDMQVMEAFGPTEGLRSEAARHAQQINDAANQEHILEAELFNAQEGATPTHPLVATSEQATETGLRYFLTQMVAADVDVIAISPGQALIDRGEGNQPDQQAGMHAAYDPDGSLAKALLKILKGFDPSIEMTVGPLKSSKDGRVFKRALPANLKDFISRYEGIYGGSEEDAVEYLRRTSSSLVDEYFSTDADILAALEAYDATHQFATFPLTQKVKDAVRGHGVSLFAFHQGTGEPPAESPRTNKNGFILKLPFRDKWGDPRFNADDRAHALGRLQEMQTMPVKDVPWSEIVQARRDINEIIAQLYYYKPEMTVDEIRKDFNSRRGDFVSDFMWLRSRENTDNPPSAEDGLRNVIYNADAVPEIADFGRAARMAVEHMESAQRYGVTTMLHLGDEEEPAQARPRKRGTDAVLERGIGEKLPSGFYFAIARRLEEAPDNLFPQGGRAVLNWLMKNKGKEGAISRAEIEHFRLQELFGGINLQTREYTRATRDDFRRAIAERMFDFRRASKWFNPERSPGDYAQGGTRVFSGPRIPGRGVYFEETAAFPKRLKGSAPFAPGHFESPHWGGPEYPKSQENAWASWRGSLRDFTGEAGDIARYGKMLVGEEGQSDFMQGASTGRRPRVTQERYFQLREEREVFRQVRNDAQDLVYRLQRLPAHMVGGADVRRILGAVNTHPSAGIDQENLEPKRWWDAYWAAHNALTTRLGELPDTPAPLINHQERTDVLYALRALNDLQVLRRNNERFFAPDALKTYGKEIESSYTPETPIDATYVRNMARQLLLIAARKGADSVAISTSDTTDRIQANTYRSAAHFYDAQMKPSLEAELRRLTGDKTIELEEVKLPKAMGAPRNEKAYTVWAYRLSPELRERIKRDGLRMMSAVPHAPLLGVHSTSAQDFERFKVTQKRDAGYWGDGVYLFPMQYAQEFGRRSTYGVAYGGREEGARSIPIAVDAKRPFVITNRGHKAEFGGAGFDSYANVDGDFEALRAHGWPYPGPPVYVWNQKGYNAERSPPTAEEVAADQERRRRMSELFDREDALRDLERQRPLTADEAQQLRHIETEEAAIGEEMEMADKKGRPEARLAQQFTKALLSAGYDAVLIQNKGEQPYEMVAIKPGTVRGLYSGTEMFSDAPIADRLATLPAGEQTALTQEVQQAVDIIARIAGKDIKVELYPQISASVIDPAQQHEGGPATAGGYFALGQTDNLDGSAVIALATQDPLYDVRTTAGHEAFHYVEFVLANDAERRIIRHPAEVQRMLRDWVAPEIGLSPSDPQLRRLLDRETRAIAFQRYRRMREEGLQPGNLHIAIRRLWDRIIRLLRAVQNIVAGRASVREALAGAGSFESVFERARTGEIVRAFRNRERPSQEIESLVAASMVPGRRKVTAAIKIGDEVFTGFNHGLALEQAAEKLGQDAVDRALGDLSRNGPFRDGFVDETGNFMSRAEAAAYLGLVEPGEDVFLSSEQTTGRMRFQDKRFVEGQGWVHDPEQDDSSEPMGSIIPTAVSRAYNDPMGTLDKVRTGVQDRMLPARRIQEAIEASTGSALPLDIDVYVAEALYHGRAGERLEDLRAKVVEPILATLRRADIPLEDFGEYLYARHAEERNREIEQIDPANTEGSGMSDAEAQAILAGVRASGKQRQYDAATDMLDDMLQEARNTLLRSGLIDRGTYNNWSTKYTYYVPLRGFETDTAEDAERPRTGRGFDVRGPEARRALGRHSRANNPLLYAVMQSQQAIVRAEKNRVDQTLYRLIEAHPDPDLWRIHKGEMRRRLNPSTGLVEDYWVPPAFVHADNIHGVKIAGKQHWMELRHPGLARAMRGVGKDLYSNAAVRALMTLTRSYAKLLTSYNPEFVASNFFRDIETALLNVGDVAGKPKDIRRQIVKEAVSLKSIRGVMAALNSHEGRTIFGGARAADETAIGTRRSAAAQDYARWFEEYRLAGGKISFMEVNDVERIKQDILKSLERGRTRRVFARAARIVEDLNTSVENGVRLSTYIALRKAGIEQDRAAFIARELTVNFNRKGEWGPLINAAYMFFNASAQGTVRIAQALARSKKVRYAVLSILATGLALDLFNYLAAGDDDDGENFYDKIPQWIKERNLIIMIPGGRKGDYFTIPLAYGYNVFFHAGQQLGAVMRTAVGAGKTGTASAAGSVLGAAWDAFNPMGSAASVAQFVSPTLADPFVQLWRNETWYGGRIRPTKHDRRQPESESYFASVHPFFKETARIMNSATGGNRARSGLVDVSPEVLEHFAEFLGGGVGKFVLNAINSGQRLVGGEEWLPEKTPFMRRLYGVTTTGAGRQREFYTVWDEVDRAMYEYRSLARSDDAAAASEAEQRSAVEIAHYGDMRGVSRLIAANRRQITQINADASLSASERRRQIDALRAEESAEILRVLKAYREAKERAKRGRPQATEVAQ